MTAATTTPMGPPGMSPKAKDTIGPELGIGGMLGASSTEPMMMLKSCIGDRALGWDLMPPGVPQSSYTDNKGQKWTYAGYHDSPEKWPAGTTPTPMGWCVDFPEIILLAVFFCTTFNRLFFAICSQAQRKHPHFHHSFSML